MTTALQKANQNYDTLRNEHGVVDTRFYIGEISDCTPTGFAEEANLVMDAYMNNDVSEVTFNDANPA